MRTHLAKRLAKLEELTIPRRANRMLLRFEGPGSEGLVQPTQEEIDEGLPVLVVRIIAARDGRPLEPSMSSATDNG